MLGAALLLAGDDSYPITNSIRLNGTSDYLSKTLTTSTTTSGSVWVKRAKLGATSPIFDNKVYFTSGDALYAFGLTSTALYRDPTAWMHIFWNGTGVYVNGTMVTGTGSYTAASITNPRLGYDGTNYFSGYLSDFAFWDGISASLQGGATNSDGVWAARRPSAGYSFLAFGSSGALGTDTSGNGNNWTVNGSPAQTTDTPTNNYATLNPLHIGSGDAFTFDTGNLGVTGASSTVNRVAGTAAVSGKFYFEARKKSSESAGNYQHWGVTDATQPLSTTNLGGPTAGASEWVLNDGYGGACSALNNGGSVGTGLSPIAQNDVVRIAVDTVAGKIWFGRNGTWSGDPDAGTGAAYTNVPSEVLPLQHIYTTQASLWNFGATALAYTPPTGFLPLCTGNLTSTAVTTSGTFIGNVNADGPSVWANGNPATLTINGNAVTFGTHADKTAGGFKLRTSSASYNTSGSNTWTATAGKRFVSTNGTPNTAQGNP